MALFATEGVSGLLVVTNFLELSDVLLASALAAPTAATGAFGDWTGEPFETATGLFALVAGATGAAFFGGVCLAAALAGTGFAGAFATAFLTGTLFTGVFAEANDAFTTGLAAALADAPRAAGFARAGAFAACAFLPAFCLLFTIPRPIL
ncbi:MAG: hypothetical protein ABIR62_00270 [Dokdonella sp.]|uniref:hypothetical protein n=1 Tax=Dokdonella sp. TaxID=2291710 RepID=UPI0032660DA4